MKNESSNLGVGTNNPRRQRGILIAQRSKIKKTSRGWRVPSQKKHTYYNVGYGRLDDKLSCTCPDYQERLEKCKHIFAVEHLTEKEGTKENLTRAKPIKPTYPQAWSAYDTAKTREKELFMELLNDLCELIEQPEYEFGRPKLPMKDMIFASALKVYSTFSLRRFMTDIKIAYEKSCISKKPCFSSVSHFMQKEELTPLLMQLIQISSFALKNVETNFAVDSSGFSTSQFGRWYDFRYGKDQVKRIWIKAHLMCGVKTNIVTAIKLTHGYSNDTKEMPELVNTTAKSFKIEEASADKGYLSKANMLSVMEHGGKVFIPFKSNSSGNASKSKIWKKMFHMFIYNQEEFLQHYHKRSNVETTFHMIKANFGTTVRSKNGIAQINEVLLKILCHNICVVIQEMFELGIEANFNNLNGAETK